jgi:hypothetical protein
VLNILMPKVMLQAQPLRLSSIPALLQLGLRSQGSRRRRGGAKVPPIKEVSKKSQGKLQPAFKPVIRSAAKHSIDVGASTSATTVNGSFAPVSGRGRPMAKEAVVTKTVNFCKFKTYADTKSERRGKHSLSLKKKGLRLRSKDVARSRPKLMSN